MNYGDVVGLFSGRLSSLLERPAPPIMSLMLLIDSEFDFKSCRLENFAFWS